MKKNKILSLLLFLLVVSTRAQELQTKGAEKPSWNLMYFTIYDHEIASYHSLGIGISTKDIRINAGFTFCNNELLNSFNYKQDEYNYFNSGNSYGAFLKPEFDFLKLGKHFKLSVNGLLNFTNTKLSYSNRGVDTTGAFVGFSAKQNSNAFQFYYGLNADVYITKHLSLGAGVVAKLFTYYIGQSESTNFSKGRTDDYYYRNLDVFAFKNSLDPYYRWIYPTAFIRYQIPFKQ
ncbi:MAG: hypothetical protein MUF75_10080 [Bacteroidia bacterium]|jgi:hypothetical protein|nr:hypothetical protein [Bacteroidia bacterium]